MKNQPTPKNHVSFMDTACRMSFDLMQGELHYLRQTFDSAFPDEPGAMPQIMLEKNSTVFNMQSFTKTADISVSQLEMLKRIHDVDMKLETTSALIEQDERDIEKSILKIYTELGSSNSENLLTSWQQRMRKIFKKLTFPVYVENSGDFSRSLMLYSNSIASSSRRGRGDFVVVGPVLSALIHEESYFVFENTGAVSRGGIYFLGSLPGIQVFVDPTMENLQFVMGRKTKNSEPGTYFMEGKRDTGEIANFGVEPSVKIIVRSQRSIFSTPDSNSNYISQKVIIGRKPWWRKLFKL